MEGRIVCSYIDFASNFLHALVNKDNKSLKTSYEILKKLEYFFVDMNEVPLPSNNVEVFDGKINFYTLLKKGVKIIREQSVKTVA